MELPLFYAPGIQETSGQYALDENASRHCLHSLRKKTGDEVLLTDGNGKKFRGSISGITAGRCTVELICTELVHLPAYPYPSIAIPIPGNNSRWEWLVEKAVEIGISGIHPLKTGRSLKANLKETRIRQIMVSAMIQSRQYILPQLNPVQAFGDFISRDREGLRFIAHCMEGNRGPVPEKLDRREKSLLLIGPEGDFTPEEIASALTLGFIPVSLGDHRLRMETAAVVSLTLVHGSYQTSLVK